MSGINYHDLLIDYLQLCSIICVVNKSLRRFTECDTFIPLAC